MVCIVNSREDVFVAEWISIVRCSTLIGVHYGTQCILGPVVFLEIKA